MCVPFDYIINQGYALRAFLCESICLAVGGGGGRRSGGVREQARCESSGSGRHESVYRGMPLPLPLLRLLRSGETKDGKIAAANGDSGYGWATSEGEGLW